MEKKHILIICGEASGELHAASLAKAILEINPQIGIWGVGGMLLSNAGAKVIYDIKDLAVLGFFDVLKKLPKFFSLKNLLLKKIREEKPAAIILVDFSGFNLRLAKSIPRSIPTIYYISPQVWASRAGRIKTIKKYIRKMIVFFKFEEELYRKAGIDVDFIGHPLLDMAKPTTDKQEFFNNLRLSESKTTIALLPGSRQQEIENILPVMLKTAALISKKIDAQFIIAKSLQLDYHIYSRCILRLSPSIDLKISEAKTYECLEAADFCLVASGTATLETAIMQKPFAVIYKMNLLNYLFYRPQVRIPYIGMVNIVAKRKVVPEFIQFKAIPEKIASYVLEILKNPSQLERMRQDLNEVKSLLGEKGATQRAAKIILQFINN